jgi:Holliday junction resolvase
MSEQAIQRKIIKRLEQEGFYVIKLITTNKNGIPDLIAIKENETIFIEVKRPDGKLSEIQKLRIQELRSKNIKVKVWQSYDEDFINSKNINQEKIDF